MQDTVDVVRNGMPSKTFDEMMSVLRKFVSFMNLTVRKLLIMCTVSLFSKFLFDIICTYLHTSWIHLLTKHLNKPIATSNKYVCTHLNTVIYCTVKAMVLLLYICMVFSFIYA